TPFFQFGFPSCCSAPLDCRRCAISVNSLSASAPMTSSTSTPVLFICSIECLTPFESRHGGVLVNRANVQLVGEVHASGHLEVRVGRPSDKHGAFVVWQIVCGFHAASFPRLAVPISSAMTNARIISIVL